MLSPIFEATPPPLIPEESRAEELLPELGFQTLYTLIKPLGNDDGARQPNRVRLTAQWQLDSGEVLAKASLQKWAEKEGIQNGLLRLMLREALQQCEALGQKGISMELIVSLDAQQLQDLSIVDFINDTVSQSKVDNSSVLIEISEGAISQSQGNATDALSRLRIKGYKIAVTTESSDEPLLAIMDKFPLDEICVDLYSLAQQGNIKGNMELEFKYSSLTSALHNKGIVACAQNIAQPKLLEFAVSCGFNWAEGSEIGEAFVAAELEAQMY